MAAMRRLAASLSLLAACSQGAPAPVDVPVAQDLAVVDDAMFDAGGAADVTDAAVDARAPRDVSAPFRAGPYGLNPRDTAGPFGVL